MKSVKIIILSLLLTCSIFPSQSQWIPCQGIEGGSVSSITYQDTALFSVGFGGIFRRQLDAESWDSACLIYNVRKVRSTGNALFTYGGNIMSQLFRSLDNGNSWEELSLASEYHAMETVDSVIFIGTYDGFLFCSSDNGESWTDINPASYPAAISALFSQPGILFCQLIDIDTLFRSDNYGNNWITYPLNGMSGSVCPYLFNGSLWLAQENNFFIFNDPDKEWILQNDSLPPGTLVSSFIEVGGSIACYTNDGYYLFDPLNSMWQDQSQGLENRRIWDACTVENAIYLATESGPFSKTGNEDWTPWYDDLFGHAVSHAFGFGGKTYALANEKIYSSTDIENGFEPIQSEGYCPAYDIVVTEDGWYEGSACGFSISIDSGQTWTDFSSGIEGLLVRRIAKTNVYYFAATFRDDGLFRSFTYHNAWERVPNELGTMSISDLEVLENTIFAVTSNGLYRSLDFGTTFSLLADAGTGSFLVAECNMIFLIRDYDVICSTDAGNSWQIWIDNINTPYSECMDVANSLETTVIGGFVSPEDPVSFLEIYNNENPYGKDIIDDLPPYKWSSIYNVSIDNEKIFACPSSGGLWYRDDLMVGTPETQPGSSSNSAQIKIFPNPVNDVLNISPDQEFGRFYYQITDLSGRIIISGYADNDMCQVDVSSLPNGLYFVIIHDQYAVKRTGKFIKIYSY
jgi:hypothetical protein